MARLLQVTWLLIVLTVLSGCAAKRVHILPGVESIHRVAVVNLTEGTRPSSESEFFTNEFVSVGFAVVERGHLQEVIKEAFTQSGFLDERKVAEWGRGLGVQGVVLHQILENAAPAPTDRKRDGEEPRPVCGWVRIVNAETGEIVLTYNAEVQAPGNGDRVRAAKFYAEQVVDDIRAALKERNIRIGPPARTTETKQVQTIQEQAG